MMQQITLHKYDTCYCLINVIMCVFTLCVLSDSKQIYTCYSTLLQPEWIFNDKLSPYEVTAIISIHVTRLGKLQPECILYDNLDPQKISWACAYVCFVMIEIILQSCISFYSQCYRLRWGTMNISHWLKEYSF